jgi:hypothetical protein
MKYPFYAMAELSCKVTLGKFGSAGNGWDCGDRVVINSRMPLILILVILLLVVGGGGYYMGPGVGYYGGGTLDIIIVLVIVYLLFGRGRSRL